MCPLGRWMGKLKGPSTAATPRGRNRHSAPRCPGAGKLATSLSPSSAVMPAFALQACADLPFESSDGGWRKLHFRIWERADGAQRAKSVTALCALDAHQPSVEHARRRLRAGGEPLPRELGAAKAADGLDQLRRRRV